ncbi:cytochrome C biogenesis transmembrane region family protein, partial [Vibrio parahaemolyticus AQ3810]
ATWQCHRKSMGDTAS